MYGYRKKKHNGLVWNSDILDAINKLDNKVDSLIKDVKKMALNLDNLVAEVARLETVEKSAVELIKQLLDEVQANKEDPAAIQALVDKMKASTDELAAAVANVPAEPAPADQPQ